jgi:hypothetical protein
LRAEGSSWPVEGAAGFWRGPGCAIVQATMHPRSPQFPPDEQVHLMLEQLLGTAAKIPRQPSPRVIRDLLARRLRAGPLSVGEQLSAAVLLVDHTRGDAAFWGALLRNRALDVTARVTLLKSLTYIAEVTGRPLDLKGLDADDLETLIEPRMMHDALVHLADGVFIQDVQDVLRQIPAHEQVVYWHQAERCRRRARIAATLMWGPSLFPDPLPALTDLSLAAIDAEPGQTGALVLSEVVRAVGASRASVLAARRIPVMEAAPRREGRLPVTALRSAPGPSGERYVTFSIEHPETAWLVGDLRLRDDDEDLQVAQLDLTTLPPRFNHAAIEAKGIVFSPITPDELYDQVLAGCRAMLRGGAIIPYGPLLLLGMLEGTTPPEAPPAPRRPAGAMVS